MSKLVKGSFYVLNPNNYSYSATPNQVFRSGNRQRGEHVKGVIATHPMKSFAVFPNFTGRPLPTMNNSVLTTSPWKLFLAFASGVVLSEMLALATAKLLNWDLGYGPYPTLKYGLISTVLCAYPYMVCRALTGKSPTGANAHRQVLWTYLLAVANNVLSVYYTEVYGIAWFVVLITVIVNLFCMVRVFSITAREVRSIQLNRRAYPPEYLREFFQFTFWPLCIWSLHPTLVRIGDEKRVPQ